jgi:hypothetical protein
MFKIGTQVEVKATKERGNVDRIKMCLMCGQPRYFIIFTKTNDPDVVWRQRWYDAEQLKRC